MGAEDWIDVVGFVDEMISGRPYRRAITTPRRKEEGYNMSRFMDTITKGVDSKPANHGTTWTGAEDYKLMDHFAMWIKGEALRHERTPLAIAFRIALNLGKVDDRMRAAAEEEKRKLEEDEFERFAKHHKAIWSWLADTGNGVKRNWPGWDEIYHEDKVKGISSSTCFACAYVGPAEDRNGYNCSKCPIFDLPCSRQKQGQLFDLWASADDVDIKKALARIIANLPWRRR